MTPNLRSLATLALAALVSATAAAKVPQRVAPPTHWVGTWATAAVDRPNPEAKVLSATTNTVLRQIVHLSLGGSTLRIELANTFGTEPLTISAATVALGNTPDLATPTIALTFNGHPAVTIPAGATIYSDPVALPVPALADLTITLALPAQPIAHITQHNSAYQTNYLAEGTDPATKSLTTPKKFASWWFLKAVDVQAPESSASIVAFGDSITDGTASTPDTNRRWPDVLARRLQADPHTAHLGVLNVGIGGNRVLHDNTGPNALARFDRDVLAQSGVKYLILLESINDIGHAYDPKKPYDVVTAEDLITGFQQLIDRAHAHNIKVFGATLTPFVGAGYSSPEGEKVREAVNQWIRASKSFDGLVDFDNATQDPANPTAFLPADDRGDHLHPNDAGLEAMGKAIHLTLFQ